MRAAAALDRFQSEVRRTRGPTLTSRSRASTRSRNQSASAESTSSRARSSGANDMSMAPLSRNRVSTATIRQLRGVSANVLDALCQVGLTDLRDLEDYLLDEVEVQEDIDDASAYIDFPTLLIRLFDTRQHFTAEDYRTR